MLTSQSGLQFLALRRDTGKYTYQRDLNPSLAVHVSGDISLEWAARTVRIEPGRSVIKISLATGDEMTACVRWLRVHTQVEALLQLAQITANIAVVRKKVVLPVEGLVPGVIATIAGQSKHDRLDAHDQGWIDPTFTSPLASVVLTLLRKGAVKAADGVKIEGARRAVEANHRDWKDCRAGSPSVAIWSKSERTRPGMERDTLLLLRPGFEDPAYPGQVFYCWHCALMEGVLASFPDFAIRLDVHRIAWPRPRHAAIKLVGEANQSLPLLVLAKGQTSKHQTGTFEGRSFIADKDRILAALSERHGFPDPHP